MWHQLQNTRSKKKVLVTHLIYLFANSGNKLYDFWEEKYKQVYAFIKGVKLMPFAGQGTDSAQRRLQKNWVDDGNIFPDSIR